MILPLKIKSIWKIYLKRQRRNNEIIFRTVQVIEKINEKKRSAENEHFCDCVMSSLKLSKYRSTHSVCSGF